jgi:DNA processing protein
MHNGLRYNAIQPHGASYPSALKDLFGHFAAPDVFFLGNLDLLNRQAVGFCGSRSVSEAGIRVAEDCAQQLVRMGVVVVSGYAKGVDAVAHSTALRSGGATIVVLPEGIEHFRIKRELSNLWDWNRILVVSQFEPNAIWRADRAMERNKLIVSLSDATIVIEAGSTGGTLNAGMTALRLLKPLFVANYTSVDVTAPGNALLMKNGGKPINRSKKSGRAEIGPILAEIGLYSKAIA